MITTWFEERDFDVAAVQYIAAQRNLYDAWPFPRADWALQLVSLLPSLDKRCGRASVLIALDFAVRALDAAEVVGPAIETFRVCAHVYGIDRRTAGAARDAVRAAASQGNAAGTAAALTTFAASAAIIAAINSVGGSHQEAFCDIAEYTSIACVYADAAGVQSGTLATIVDVSIPVAWVCDAAKTDAPELLEVASP